MKNLFIYNLKNNSNISDYCISSWKYFNKDWRIIVLNKENLFKYVNLRSINPRLNIKILNINNKKYEFIIKIYLLEKYGGCICDSDLFCNKKLDNWINNYTKANFFLFMDNDNYELKNFFFIYGKKNTYILKLLIKKFVFNLLFRGNFFKKLYLDCRKVKKFNHYFNKMPQKKSDNIYFLQNVNLQNNLTSEFKNHINNISAPFYILNNNLKLCEYDNNSILYYLFKKYKLNSQPTYNNLRFIHIGKCSGSTLNKIFKIKSYHLKRNYLNNENYIIWIRNPINRFVSAFYYVKNIINSNIYYYKKLNIINLNNCLAPGKIRSKITRGYFFSKRYDFLVNYFKSANHLAESLTSENLKTKKLAKELFNSNYEHIFKGIGYYLGNNFIDKNHKKIVFVGTVENIYQDIKKLENKLNLNFSYNSKIHYRKNKKDNNKYLSKKALENILNFYKNTDYVALKKLLKYKFISEKILNDYYKYDLILDK